MIEIETYIFIFMTVITILGYQFGTRVYNDYISMQRAQFIADLFFGNKPVIDVFTNLNTSGNFIQKLVSQFDTSNIHNFNENTTSSHDD
jgi:hypothetical protein